MADETTEDKPQAASNRPGLGMLQKIVLAVALLPFALLFLPTVAVLLLGMLPTLSALIADRDPQKHLVVTVGLLNFCGVIHPMLSLWELGQSYEAMNLVIGEVYNWLVAYGAAGCGWMIYIWMPSVAKAYYRVATETRVRMLMARKRKLVETWGDEVSGDTQTRGA